MADTKGHAQGGGEEEVRDVLNEDHADSCLVTVLFRHFMYRSSDINFIYDCVDQIFVLT